jgi:hypothetical protein
MSAENHGRYNGEAAGWTSGLRKKQDLSTLDDAPATVFTPCLRGVVCGVSGNIVVTLDGDDPADATKKVTIAMTAGTYETRFAIRKVWLTGTTATGLQGFS